MRHAELGVDRRPCFFLHIRHTGGTTLERRIHHNFGAEEWYPFSGEDRAKIVQAKVRSGSWLGLSSRQLAAVDFFSLHQPLWVRDALAARLGVQPYTLTLLRDPVERTLSQVKRLAAIANWSESLEDFYRIPRVACGAPVASPPVLFATLLALASAGLHAAWNLFVKTSDDRELAAWGQWIAGGLLFLPFLLFAGLPDADALPFLFGRRSSTSRTSTRW